LFLGEVCPSNVICADGTAFRLGDPDIPIYKQAKAEYAKLQ
jgi:hypothetical protein